MGLLNKQKSDGSLDRYKGCPVAIGNGQEYGISYHETFDQNDNYLNFISYYRFTRLGPFPNGC